MTGKELYQMHQTSMREMAAVRLEDWENLSEHDQMAWDETANQVNEEINEAVVDAIPPVEAGQRTDV